MLPPFPHANLFLKLFQPYFLSSWLGVDPQDRVERADCGDPRHNQDHAQPTDGVLQGVKDIAHKNNAHHDADDAVDFSNIVFQ